MHNRSLLLGRRGSLVILLCNCVGALIYLWGARHAWVIPEEAANGVHSITSEPLIWGLFVMPVWIVFAAINIAWGVAILARKKRFAARFWLSTALIWIVAIVIDYAHH
jgi:hypothetical protein